MNAQRLGNQVFDELLPVQGGWFYARTQDKWKITDDKGQEVFKIASIEEQDQFRHVWVINNEGFGVLDSTGKVIAEPKYKWIGQFYAGFAAFGLNNKVGLMNEEGQIVVPAQYESIKPYKSAYYGYVDKNLPIPGYIDNLWELKGKTKAWLYHRENGLVDTVGCSYFSMFSENLARCLIGRKVGFIDSLGRMAIPATFDEANDFQNGLSRVSRTGAGAGMINRKGEIVVPLRYMTIEDFKNGFAVAWLSNNQKHLINSAGKIVSGDQEEDVPPTVYDHEKTADSPVQPSVSNTQETITALIQIEQGGKIGYKNARGIVKIPPRYDMIGAFKDGLAYVKNDGLFGIIDTNGRELAPLKYAQNYGERKGDFFEFNRRMGYEHVYLYVSPQGKVSQEYDYCFPFYNGISIVKQVKGSATFWGAINRAGADIVPLSANYVQHFSGKYLEIREKDTEKCWLVDIETGEKRSKLYDRGFFQKGVTPFYRVMLAHKYGMVDTFGNEVVPPLMDSIFYLGDWTVVKKSTQYGLYDAMFKPVLPLEYDFIDHDVNGRVVTRKAGVWAFTPVTPGAGDAEISDEKGWNAVYQNGKWGWKDASGKTVIPCRFDAVMPFQHGKAWVFLESFGRPFRVNRKGAFVLEYYP